MKTLKRIRNFFRAIGTYAELRQKAQPSRTCITINFANGSIKQHYVSESVEQRLQAGDEMIITTGDPAQGHETLSVGFAPKEDTQVIPDHREKAQAAIAANMRAMREFRGVSIRAMAIRLRCSSAWLSDLERGKRRWTKKWQERYLEALEKG